MRKLAFLGVLLAALLVALAPSATAGSDKLDLQIKENVTLVGDGEAILVRVKTRCPEGAQMLEAFVYVTQDGFTSQFRGIPFRCDGRPLNSTVRVLPLDQPFHEGEARVSGYMLLTTGESVSPTRIVRIR